MRNNNQKKPKQKPKVNPRLQISLENVKILNMRMLQKKM